MKFLKIDISTKLFGFKIRMDKYINIILDTVENVSGEIYIITNTVTQKSYVGQTVSHRKNRKKYRPFGYNGRFKDHISEAMCNTKAKQCAYLNSSIRKYKPKSFIVEFIERCSINNLDDREKYWISEKNTLFPLGYNLTKGGRTVEKMTYTKPQNDNISSPTENWRNLKKSEDTKQKISENVKKSFDDDRIKKYSTNMQNRFLQKKLDKISDILDKIDLEDVRIRRGIYEKTNLFKNFEVLIDDRRISFYKSKHESEQDTYQRAISFLEILRHRQIAGKSLELYLPSQYEKSIDGIG